MLVVCSPRHFFMMLTEQEEELIALHDSLTSFYSQEKQLFKVFPSTSPPPSAFLSVPYFLSSFWHLYALFTSFHLFSPLVLSPSLLFYLSFHIIMLFSLPRPTFLCQIFVTGSLVLPILAFIQFFFPVLRFSLAFVFPPTFFLSLVLFN